MAEQRSPGPPSLQIPQAVRPGTDVEEDVREFTESLRSNDKLQALGLSERAEELLQSVLCALWRNTPLQELEGVRGALPAGLDLMFGTCDKPHGKRSPPRVFLHSAVVDDITEHLGIPRDQALAAFHLLFDELRGLFLDNSRSACLGIESPELLALMRCPT